MSVQVSFFEPARNEARVGRWGFRRALDVPLWGDGWLEASLSTLWHRCTWDDVSDDELALLIPSLALSPTIAAQHGAGSAGYLRDALAAQLCAAVHLLARDRVQEEDTVFSILYEIELAGVMTTLSPWEAWAQRKASFERIYSFPLRETQVSDGAVDETIWIHELAVLACLDRLLWSAAASKTASSTEARPLRLSDALVASIHSGCNAAYACPEFVASHELLAAGAWLGYLLRGRPALMPFFVAEYIEELYCSQGNSSATDPCGRIMRFYADVAVGRAKLLKAARKVRRRRFPVTVGPARRAGTLRSPAAHTWNPELFSEMATRFSWTQRR